jgi:predicted phosphodiesterase
MKIGVCSDPHGHADRLRAVLDEMSVAGAQEVWCLGDLIGEGPDPAGVIQLARQFDLVLAGNHDAWLLAGRAWPEARSKLTRRDLLWLSSLSPARERHDVKCWHGTPSGPLLDFLDDLAAPRELFGLAPGTLGLIGHTHIPHVYFREQSRVWGQRPLPEQSLTRQLCWVVLANPGAVAGSEEDTAPWWLELDLDLRSLCWHRIQRCAGSRD